MTAAPPGQCGRTGADSSVMPGQHAQAGRLRHDQARRAYEQTPRTYLRVWLCGHNGRRVLPAVTRLFVLNALRKQSDSELNHAPNPHAAAVVTLAARKRRRAGPVAAGPLADDGFEPAWSAWRWSVCPGEGEGCKPQPDLENVHGKPRTVSRQELARANAFIALDFRGARSSPTAPTTPSAAGDRGLTT